MGTVVPTVSRTIQDFLELVGVGSLLTMRTYNTGLRHWQEYLRHRGIGPNMPVDKITTKTVSGFLPWLQRELQKAIQGTADDVNPSTLRTYLVAVIKWYEFCIIHGEWLPITVDDFERMRRSLYEKIHVESRVLEHRLPKNSVLNPVLELVRGPQPPEPPREKPLTEAAVRRHRLAWLRNRAIVEVLLTSGMRVRELCSLRRRDLLDGRRVEVLGKGKRHRVVFLSRMAWEAVQEYLRERDGERGSPLSPLFAQHSPRAGNNLLPMSTQAVQRVFQDIAQAAHIQDFHLTPHTLRHAFATRMLEATENLAMVQDMLGHASPDTTRIYAQVKEGQMRRAHRKVWDPNEPPNEGEEEEERLHSDLGEENGAATPTRGDAQRR